MKETKEEKRLWDEQEKAMDRLTNLIKQGYPLAAALGILQQELLEKQ